MRRFDLRDGAARLRRWCTGLGLVLLAIIVFEIASRAAAFVAADRYYLLGLDLLFAVPALLQLAAVWSIRQGLSDVAGGALFTTTLSRMLRQVGILLFLSASCTLVLAPVLHRLAAATYPRLIEFDVANLVLGALGLTLSFLARLFEHAVAMQRELDEIF